MKTKLLRLFRKRFTIQVEVKIPPKYKLITNPLINPTPPTPRPMYIVTNHKTHKITKFDMTNPGYEDMIIYCLEQILGYGDGYSEGKGKRLYYKNRQKREYNIQIRKNKLNGAYKIIL